MTVASVGDHPARIVTYWRVLSWREPLSAESCELRVSEDDLDWLAVKIAMLGHPFEVREPPELIDRLGLLRDRISAGLPGEG